MEATSKRMTYEPILWLNNITSLTVILACWWLAHMYSIARQPYGKCIAASYGFFGLMVMGAAIARNLQWNTELWAIGLKLSATFMFTVVAYRLHKKYDIT